MAQLLALVVIAGGICAFVGGRYAVIRYAGATRFREGLFITRERWDAASPLVKVGFCLAGPLAMYLLSAILFFFAFKQAGEHKRGEPTQVNVAEGKPAVKAGVRDGDKIVRINGAPVSSFDDLSSAVQSSKGEIEIELERGTELISFEVFPEVLNGPGGERRVIGVRPYTAHAELSVVGAASRAAGVPAKVVATRLAALSDLLFGPKTEELGGPAGMVQEKERARGQGFDQALALGGAFIAYEMFLLTVISVFSIPWRKRKKQV